MAYLNGKKIIFSPHVHINAGANQPTLYAPVISQNGNTVTWVNDPRNGGFLVILSANVDGAGVTSPLTITPMMDGKTLKVIANAINFNSNTTELVLSYSS